jgi:hypothetical protein
MNKERILALADLVEQQPHSLEFGFNMGELIHGCGTPSCIAGWAAWEKAGRPEMIVAKEGYATENEASDWLGLPHIVESPDDNDLSFDLFYPLGFSFEKITPKHAAFTLRHLAETGKVDWRAYGPEALQVPSL